MDPFVGQIKVFAFGYAPKNWALCDGAVLPIAQYRELHSLVGTKFGGDGVTTFGLPNLQGRLAVHVGAEWSSVTGQVMGAAQHTLAPAEMPAESGHIHSARAVNTLTDATDPTGRLLGNAPGQLYAPFNQSTATALVDGTISPAAGGGAHDNQMPTLALNVCIALKGVFPPPPEDGKEAQ